MEYDMDLQSDELVYDEDYYVKESVESEEKDE